MKSAKKEERKGNVLFNDALNTFYLQLYGVGHMVKDHSDSERGNPLPVTEETSFINITILYRLISTNEKCKERGKEMFYLTMHSTHFIYSYMASDIW